MLYIDSSDINEVRKWIQEYGICRGVTTNQKILLKDKQTDIRQTILNILEVSNNLPVNVEITKTSGTDDELIYEATEYHDISHHIIIKIPMWSDGRGLRISRRLKKIGVSVNITACMSTEQIILATLAGVEYTSLFFNRMADYYHQSEGYGKHEAYDIACETITESRDFLNENGLDTQLIVGSIRDPRDVTIASLSGADIVTVPPNILKKMFQHPKTEETITEFDNCWKELCNKK